MKVIETLSTETLDSLKKELDSHKERMDENESSIVILSLNNKWVFPRLTSKVQGKDRVKMLGAMYLAIHDLTENLLEEW